MEEKDLRERLVDIMHYDGTYSTSDLVKFIQQELNRAREEGKLIALEHLKDYVFINNNRKNGDKVSWDSLKNYIKEMEGIYKK